MNLDRDLTQKKELKMDHSPKYKTIMLLEGIRGENLDDLGIAMA